MGVLECLTRGGAQHDNFKVALVVTKASLAIKSSADCGVRISELLYFLDQLATLPIEDTKKYLTSEG